MVSSLYCQHVALSSISQARSWCLEPPTGVHRQGAGAALSPPKCPSQEVPTPWPPSCSLFPGGNHFLTGFVFSISSSKDPFLLFLLSSLAIN